MLTMRPHFRPSSREGSGSGVEGRGKVDRDDRVPLLGGKLVDRRNMLDAGIVDEDVDASRIFRPGSSAGALLARYPPSPAKASQLSGGAGARKVAIASAAAIPSGFDIDRLGGRSRKDMATISATQMMALIWKVFRNAWPGSSRSSVMARCDMPLAKANRNEPGEKNIPRYEPAGEVSTSRGRHSIRAEVRCLEIGTSDLIGHTFHVRTSPTIDQSLSGRAIAPNRQIHRRANHTYADQADPGDWSRRADGASLISVSWRLREEAPWCRRSRA